MSTNFWELLHQRQDELTKSGRMVADYLIHHADEAQYLSISSLARECKVAEATVFRFCRALGFEGYHEMRIALAQANATASLINQQEPEPGTTTDKLCEHASALFITAINGTQSALSPDAVDKAVDLLRAARQVFCLGQGGSMLLANDICARFSSMAFTLPKRNFFRKKNSTRILMTENKMVQKSKSNISTLTAFSKKSRAPFSQIQKVVLLLHNDHQQCNNETINSGCFCQCTAQQQCLVDRSGSLRLSGNGFCCLGCCDTDAKSCTDTCQYCDTCSYHRERSFL